MLLARLEVNPDLRAAVTLSLSLKANCEDVQNMRIKGELYKAVSVKAA